MANKVVSISMKISREKLIENMDKLMLLYIKVTQENTDLTIEEILKICKINGKAKKEFLLYLENGFCVETIEEYINIDKKLLSDNGKSSLINKLNNFKREEIKRYAKLKSEVSFFSSTGNGKDGENRRLYNKGHKVQFEYEVSQAGLFVFRFDSYLFPLRADEFEWVI